MNAKSLLKTLGVLITLALTCHHVRAHPYASGVTNDNGTIKFVLNEGGGTVDVVFEDNTTNSLGVLGRGPQSFALGSHTSFAIYVSKQGNGTPSLISVDTDQYAIYANGRGVAVNKNPKSTAFGRIYTGSGGTGGYAYGSIGYKPRGLFALNADYTEALGRGTNAAAQDTFAASGTSGPWRIRVAPDDTLLVDDFSTPGAALWQFKPDLSDSNLVLAIIGQTAAAAAGIHGDFFGTPTMTGSLAEGNLVLWTADSGMAVPAGTTLGPGTGVGDYNCVFRYDIGAGPLPWNHPPNYAYTVGLSGIAELRPEVEIGPDGKIIAGFGRANLSNPNLQILNPTGDTLLWTSWNDTGGKSDPWRGEANGTTGGTYAGVRVSPDGVFLASVDLNNGVTLALLTNGIPDSGSIFGITNAPTTGNSRGMDWDAADNIYVISSGQGLLRTYSLGITTTCITSNDFTGTNGSFRLVLPSVTASGTATTTLASQNYGSPTPGVFRISLNQGTLAGPVTVNFTRGGTAAYVSHYTLNTNETPNGVTIAPNSVTFPAGTMPGGGNWYVDLKVTPTAVPVSTNTLTVALAVSGGPTYRAVAPLSGTIFIQNTGPQLLLLTPAASGATMYRGVTNDYAKFIITRLGDTNGPGNSIGNVNPKSYTVTNVTYLGTAVYPGDYKARAQRLDPAGDGNVVPPVDGPTAIVINPGDTTITCAIGSPVRHTNLGAVPQDLTIIVSLTNSATGVNGTSQEGDSYTANTATTTLTLIDNAVGPEQLLWSNPLTNAADSVNWTLTYAATNFGPGNLPVVAKNYTNDYFSIASGGTNDFLVHFGEDITGDSIPQSQVMAANGWNNALKMTVNKQSFSPTHSGVNVYPQGQLFQGNYALRFNMYLSMYQFALDNPGSLANAREFAAFGVNHYGTNCNWRTDSAGAANGGMMPTNSDGIWFTVDAGAGSITPADFDALVPPPVPNNANPGALNDKVSASAASQNGVFKHPPFAAGNVTASTIANPGGGQAINRWVDVSVEVKRQTNINLYINRSLILNCSTTNGPSLDTAYKAGTIMLGYLDPGQNQSDNSAFVYYSNLRVVELSPYILVQAGLTNSLADRLIVTQGSSLTLTSSAAYATAPITNTWYRGTGNYANNTTAPVPTQGLQTNSANATSMTDTFTWTFNNPADGTNYMSVFSDAAGSITSSVVAVEVVFGPTNQTADVGSLAQFQVRGVGPIAPALYQWRTNGVNLANNSHYAGVTTSTLYITNVAPSDAVTYSVIVSNVAGIVTPSATLTLNVTEPPSFSGVSLTGGNAVMSFTSANPADTSSSFTLQSSIVVEGPYTNNPAALFSGTNPNFQVSVPQTPGNMFYRLLHH